MTILDPASGSGNLLYLGPHALLNPDDWEAAWPETDVIVGNPPFGDWQHRRVLGAEYDEP